MRSLFQPLARLFFLVAIPLAIPAAICPSASAQAAGGGRVVLVLPFDNHSGNASLNWISDSFPDTLNKRLASAGFLTISRDDRLFAYDHLGLPADFRPTRATTIRIAQQLDANFVVVGSYVVQPNSGAAGGDRISIQARVLSVDDLKLSQPIDDGAELSRLFDAENAVAWKTARALDPHFALGEATFLSASSPVPLPAFEDYIRGSATPNPAERLKRLEAAVTLVPGYSAAILALGKEQYQERSYDAAAATLSKLPPNDPLSLEANFYLGLSRFNSANYAGAQQAFEFVDSRLPLPEVVNDQGVALSRQGKDGFELYERASQADPSEEDYHYNLAVALFRRGDTAGAQREVDAAIKLKPADGEATELRNRLKAVPAGTRLTANLFNDFVPLERIRRSYSEASYRQAAFQLNQLRAARLALLPKPQRIAEYLQQGRDYLQRGLFPEAEAEVQSALTEDPNSADAHAALAQIAEASHNADRARNEARQSIILQPNVTALLVLARLDIAANNLSAAATDVSQALSVNAKSQDALAMKMTLQQRGQNVP